MDTSPGEDGDASQRKSKAENCSGDGKHAVVVLVAPDGQRDQRLQKTLVESLRKGGISPEIINDPEMSDSINALANIIGKIARKTENLIVVVVAGGFYHDDGEAIIFEDCFVLLDTFIHQFVAVAKSERKCKTVLFIY